MVVLHYIVLSEDYKEAWPTIIAASISVETRNQIKVVRIYLSQIRVYSDWFGCVLVISFYVAKVFSESVT